MPVAILGAADIVDVELHDPFDGTVQLEGLDETDKPDGADDDRDTVPEKPFTLDRVIVVEPELP